MIRLEEPKLKVKLYIVVFDFKDGKDIYTVILLFLSSGRKKSLVSRFISRWVGKGFTISVSLQFILLCKISSPDTCLNA